MGEKLKKGTIIEVKVPNAEQPIEAVILDITEFNIIDNVKSISLICYAQKRLFKVFYIYCSSGYYNYRYEGTILYCCKIPGISLDT